MVDGSLPAALAGGGGGAAAASADLRALCFVVVLLLWWVFSGVDGRRVVSGDKMKKREGERGPVWPTHTMQTNTTRRRRQKQRQPHPPVARRNHVLAHTREQLVAAARGRDAARAALDAQVLEHHGLGGLLGVAGRDRHGLAYLRAVFWFFGGRGQGRGSLVLGLSHASRAFPATATRSAGACTRHTRDASVCLESRAPPNTPRARAAVAGRGGRGERERKQAVSCSHLSFGFLKTTPERTRGGSCATRNFGCG